MASEGPLYPGTAFAAFVSPSTTWANAGNVMADDGNNATCDFASATGSRFIQMSNFGFAIPDDATVTGIVVEIERHRTDGGGGCEDLRLDLLLPFTSEDRSVAGAWPTSPTVAVYGADDDLWGLTPLASDINDDTGFQVRFRAQDSSQLDVANVDFVRVTVHYTEAGPTIPEVSSVTDSTFADGATGVVIAGTGFLSSQGTGKVEIGSSAVYAEATLVAQTITEWATDEITFTAVQGGLPPTVAYLYVTNDDGEVSEPATVGWTFTPSESSGGEAERRHLLLL